MVKKVHIVKSENAIDEVAIQVRDSQPSIFNEKQIYLDKNSGSLYVPKDGQYRKANIQVYASDPIGELFWINDTEGTLKWVTNGVTNSMSLTPNKISMVSSLEGFSDILSKLESGENLDVVSNDNSLIDIFNTKPSDLKNISIDHSAIKVTDETNSGVFKKSVKTSGSKNYVEGVISYKADAMQPKVITDNGDGTSTIIFDGDMTKFITMTQRFIIFEEVREEITIDDEFRTLYKEDKAKRERQKSYYLLDGLEPAILSATSVSYNMGVNETTVVLTNNGLDVSMGLTGFSQLRFMPFNVDVRGGSVVDSILLDNLQLVEAYSETSKHPDTLGSDSVLNFIRNDIADNESGHIDWVSVAHSPNRKYWLVWALVGTTTTTSDRVVIWYSNDGMRTLHKSDFYASSASAGYSIPVDYWTSTFDQYTDGQSASNELNTHISDAGEVVFVHTYQPSASYSHPKFVTGRLDLPVAKFAYNAVTTSSRKSQISFEDSGSYNYYCHTSAMDFETGIFMASANRINDDMYFQAWAIDFEKLEGHWIGHTPVYTDYAKYPYKGFSFWADYEGERRFFSGQRHVNDYWHCVSVSHYDIISEYRAGDGGDYRGGDINITSAFNSAPSITGAHDKSRILDEIGTGFICTGFDYTDGILSVWGADWDNNRNAIAIIDFGKADILKSEDLLTFDAVPDGGNMTLKFGQDNLNFHGAEINIDKDSTAQSIESSINSHDNNKCFFQSKYINGELSGITEGALNWDKQLWGRWRRNNFTSRVFTTKSQIVSDGLILDKEKLAFSSNDIINAQTNTGYDRTFKVRGEFILDPDFILNGEFINDLTNWTTYAGAGCSAVWDNGNFLISKDGSQGNSAGGYQIVNTVIGERYVFTADMVEHTGDQSGFSYPYMNILDDADNVIVAKQTSFENGKTNKLSFVATTTTTKLQLQFAGSGSGTESATVRWDNAKVQLVTGSTAGQQFLKAVMGDVQGDIRVLINGTYLTYQKGSTSGEYDPSVTINYYWDITSLLIADGITDNTLEIKGSDQDHATIRGLEIGGASTKKCGIEFEVFTKAGIDHDVEFRIYEKDGTLKHTIVAGDSGSQTDTKQTITIGREYLYGYGDYVECYSKSDSNDLKDCYVRRSQENFIAYSWREWEVSGDYANGFLFKCQRPEGIALVSNNLTSGGSAVVETLANVVPYSRQSVVNSPVLNAKYDQVKGCGVWVLGESMCNDMYHNGNVMSAVANGNRNNFNIFRNGDSIIMSFTRLAYGGGQVNSAPFLYKIPDYKEFTVKTVVDTYGIGTASTIYLTNNDGTDATTQLTYGTRFAQSVVIPSNAGDNYADGMLPLRTLSIQMSFDWASGVISNNGWQYFTDDVFIKCKVVRMTAGYPDDTKLLGEATNKLPASELPSYVAGNLDEVYFTFDNLKLTPSSEVCLIFYVEGLDIENTPNAFAPRIRTNNAVSTLGGKFFREYQNVWSEQTQSVWFTMFDVYMSDIRFMHEGGWNRNAKVVHPYADYWRDISETTIYPLKGSTNKFTGTYRNSGIVRTNNRAYSPSKAGSKTYSYSIEDTSQYSPCVVSSPDIMEANGNSDYDENLIMSIVPKDKHKVRLLDDGSLYTFTNYKTPYPESEPDYHFNRSLTVGGGNLDYSSWIDNFRQKSITNYSYGIAKHDGFKYGYCFEMKNTKMYAYYDSRAFCPFHREFIFEIEIEPDATDVDGTQNMLFDSVGLMRIAINNDKRYGVYVFNHFTGAEGWCSSEQRCVNQYHRLRVVRSHANGIEMYRNFTKDDEGAWETMTEDITISNFPWSTFKNGAQIGKNDESYNYYAIGGYSSDDSYNWHGRIGYIKYAIGDTQFKSDNIVHQEPMVRPSNRGDIILGLSNYYECSDQPTLYKTDLVYAVPDYKKSALRKSYSQNLKFKKELSNVGSYKTIEIELTKKSDEDTTEVNGMYFDFDRR